MEQEPGGVGTIRRPDLPADSAAACRCLRAAGAARGSARVAPAQSGKATKSRRSSSRLRGATATAGDISRATSASRTRATRGGTTPNRSPRTAAGPAPVRRWRTAKAAATPPPTWPSSTRSTCPRFRRANTSCAGDGCGATGTVSFSVLCALLRLNDAPLRTGLRTVAADLERMRRHHHRMTALFVCHQHSPNPATFATKRCRHSREPSGLRSACVVLHLMSRSGC